MYFLIVRGDTRRPSLSSSSFAIRSSPHEGLSRAILRIKCWSAAGIGRLPASDFQRQKRRKPLRCQATKVLGLYDDQSVAPIEPAAEQHQRGRVGLSARRGLTLRS